MIKYNMNTENRLRRGDGEFSAVRADILDRAERIATDANGSITGDDGYVVDSGVTRSRRHFRAAVIAASAEAKRAEAEGNVLTSAIDAGR